MIFKKSKNKKGFTLIEMMVSVFIFAIMMVAVVQIFAQQIKAYKYARVVAGDLENAQFALNYMSKTLRTASIIGNGSSAGGGSSMFTDRTQTGYDDDFHTFSIGSGTGLGSPLSDGLIVYDFSQEACLIFSFQDGADTNFTYEYPALWVETQTGISPTDPSICIMPGIFQGSNYKKQRLTTGSVTGAFEVAPTRYMDHKDSRSTDTMGKATISLKVEPITEKAENDNVEPVYIQSSVALRDYPSDLSF